VYSLQCWAVVLLFSVSGANNMTPEDRIAMIKKSQDNVNRRKLEDGDSQTRRRVSRLRKMDDAEFIARMTEEPIKKNPPHWTD